MNSFNSFQNGVQNEFVAVSQTEFRRLQKMADKTQEDQQNRASTRDKQDARMVVVVKDPPKPLRCAECRAREYLETRSRVLQVELQASKKQYQILLDAYEKLVIRPENL